MRERRICAWFFFCKPADAGIKLSNIITDRIKVKSKELLLLFGIKVKMIARVIAGKTASKSINNGSILIVALP